MSIQSAIEKNLRNVLEARNVITSANCLKNSILKRDMVAHWATVIANHLPTYGPEQCLQMAEFGFDNAVESIFCEV